MPPLGDLEHRGVIHQGHAVAIGGGHGGEGGEHVHLGHRRRGGLDLCHVGAHGVFQFTEQLVLQGGDLVLGGENGVLQLLELLGDVPLGVDGGLLAHPVLRHQADLGLGHLDVVAEHLVVPDLHVLDARLLLGAGLQVGHQLGPWLMTFQSRSTSGL